MASVVDLGSHQPPPDFTPHDTSVAHRTTSAHGLIETRTLSRLIRPLRTALEHAQEQCLNASWLFTSTTIPLSHETRSSSPPPHCRDALRIFPFLDIKTLTEDEIDEILCAARLNKAKELSDYPAHLAQQRRESVKPFDNLSAAVDAETGNTTLHYAAANGHDDAISLIKSLVASQSAPKLPAENGSNASSLPANLMNSVNHFINRVNASGNTALHWAALNGHLKAVQLLVKLGANPALTNNIGHDAVFEVERHDKEEVVKWFLAEVPGLEHAIRTEITRTAWMSKKLMPKEVQQLQLLGKRGARIVRWMSTWVERIILANPQMKASDSKDRSGISAHERDIVCTPGIDLEGFSTVSIAISL